MKVSGFTFLRNAQILGYPFVQSINSILPLVDEFIIALGPCEDKTEDMLMEIGSSKIQIIHTHWNEQMKTKGYVYGQQKNIAHFNCTGDWAFYLEADEVLHEDDLPKIKEAMLRYSDSDKIEALAFDFIHFYGNHLTYARSPGWYRREVRIIKNSIRSYSPDGLFFLVLESNKKARYPRAAHAGARIFHYGWVRNEDQMNLKVQRVNRYWNNTNVPQIVYSDIDGSILSEFKGMHPRVMREWFSEADSIFKANTSHKLTKREKRHRIVSAIEKLFRLDLSKKHFKLVK